MKVKSDLGQILLIFLCLFLGISGSGFAQDTATQSLPTLADLKDTWNEIIPGWGHHLLQRDTLQLFRASWHIRQAADLF